MANLFTLFTETSAAQDAASKAGAGLDMLQDQMDASATAGEILANAYSKQLTTLLESHSARGKAQAQAAQALVTQMSQTPELAKAFLAYMSDASERAVLTADALRKRGDIFLEHEEAGCPPVLIYDYEKIMDGADLPEPTNYELLRITPPEGVTIIDKKRPYIIIDPRAGHGAGIGGFKLDSQVGVALRAGHPVYFVAFRRTPEEDQRIADVTRTEAAFAREVMRRHPDSNPPVIMGNCQGGWATLLLAATNPDLTGPIIVNGAPVAPWAGEVGTNPMRYNAGVLGGTWMPMMLSDIGGGLFDGAHLVQNFEMLNPGRTLFRKYADLFRDIDKGDKRFLDFETWWGGFFLLNEAEIRWIVEQLFVGNRLVKNEAFLSGGQHVDLKNIRAPIIVFASHGDNITPPQQALNWITETYADANEIRIRGQRIIYMVHEEVGHLGIFVSSSIAKREHSQMASTMKTIEALPPGLFEMKIEDITEQNGEKHFTVSFAERKLDDIRALDDGTDDERPFAAVARASEMQAEAYEAGPRPLVQAAVTPSMAEASRALHPQRASRAAFSSKNPAMRSVETAAERIRETRHKADAGNPFLAAEALWVSGIEQSIDLWRDWRDLGYELAFHALWSTPWVRAFGASHEHRRSLDTPDALRGTPAVATALKDIEQGGFAEAVIRMLVLLADNRGTVRQDRLERSAEILSGDEPFRSLGAERRALIIQEQNIIAAYEPDSAIEALPKLLPEAQERALALAVVQYIPGKLDEMSPETRALIDRFRKVLALPAVSKDVLENPLRTQP